MGCSCTCVIHCNILQKHIPFVLIIYFSCACAAGRTSVGTLFFVWVRTAHACNCLRLRVAQRRPPFHRSSRCWAPRRTRDNTPSRASIHTLSAAAAALALPVRHYIVAQRQALGEFARSRDLSSHSCSSALHPRSPCFLVVNNNINLCARLSVRFPLTHHLGHKIYFRVAPYPRQKRVSGVKLTLIRIYTDFFVFNIGILGH